LHADLDALRQIGAFRHMRSLPGLDVNGDDDAIRHIEHVDGGRQAEPLGREKQAPCA
jgi:hypothetical protein